MKWQFKQINSQNTLYLLDVDAKSYYLFSHPINDDTSAYMHCAAVVILVAESKTKSLDL